MSNLNPCIIFYDLMDSIECVEEKVVNFQCLHTYYDTILFNIIHDCDNIAELKIQILINIILKFKSELSTLINDLEEDSIYFVMSDSEYFNEMCGYFLNWYDSILDTCDYLGVVYE